MRVVDAQGLQLKNWLVPDNKASNTEGGEVKMIQAASKSALVNKRFKGSSHLPLLGFLVFCFFLISLSFFFGLGCHRARV